MTPVTAVVARAVAGPKTNARTRLMLEGPIVSTLLRLAAPNVVVNVVLIAVTATVDAHFVGRLGGSGLAGLALVFPLLMLMQQMANSSMGGAIASAIARAIGAGRREDASALVVHGLVIAGVVGAMFTSLVLMGGPAIYGLMGGRGETLAAAVEYSNAIFAGAVVYWVLSTLTSVLRGSGQPALLAIVYIGAEILHVALVPTLVFGFGPIPSLGIAGAGVATVASFTVSSLVLAWYVISGRTAVTLSFRRIRLERRLFREILRVGAPMSLQPIINNLTLATLTGFVGVLGPTALAAFGAAVRLEYTLIPLTFGLGAALQAMAGTNIGAGHLPRAARIAWTAAGLASALTGAIGVLAMTWPAAWVAFFNATPAVHLMAASYLGIVSLTYGFLGLGMTLSSAFQAAGCPSWPLAAITGRALVVVTGGWIVIHTTHLGLVGVALVAACGLIVFGSTLAIAFRTAMWMPSVPTAASQVKAA